jgi:protein SCO1
MTLTQSIERKTMSAFAPRTHVLSRSERRQSAEVFFRLVCVVFIAALVLLALAAPANAQQQTSPGELVGRVGLDQKLDQPLPLDLMFRDEHGREVKLGDYFGDKPVVLSLVQFRCRMLCTQVLNGLLVSSQAVPFTIGQDYTVLSVSIDPREGAELAAEKKKQYVGRYRREGAEGGWHFLTGDQQAIDRLAEAVGYRYHYDPRSDQYAHPSGIVIATPAGRTSRYFYGIDYQPQALRLGLVESSENRIGSPVDQFLLLCFHYDPTTGKYGLIISNVLRLAGLVTVLVLGGFLVVSFRQELRRSALSSRQAPCAVDPQATAGPLPTDSPGGTRSVPTT